MNGPLADSPCACAETYTRSRWGNNLAVKADRRRCTLGVSNACHTPERKEAPLPGAMLRR